MLCAFAVSTSLELDVILIDEPMDVGDLAVQMRCFDRKERLKERGTTFLLASHLTTQIIAFCVFLFDVGRVALDQRYSIEEISVLAARQQVG